MSRKKILKAVLAALSVLFSAAKTIEKMGKQNQSDGRTKSKD